jgi:hypothetical protein
VVLLLHEGFGTPHIDLLLERDDGPLVTFRAPVGVSLMLDPAQAAAFEAERSPDHRRVYLDYEGPVSNQRGSVRRLATHALHAFVEAPEAISFAAAPMPGSAGPVTEWSARQDSRGLWRFEGRGRLDGPAAIAGVPR